MIKKYGDIISSVAVLIATGIYYAATFDLSIDKPAGNALVPRLTSYFLAACALFILVNALMRLPEERKSRNAASRDATVEADRSGAAAEGSEVKSDYFKVALTLAFISAYALLIPVLGFLVSTPVYLCAQIILLSPKAKRNPVRSLALSVVFTTVIYLLFTECFLLVLPTGTLW